jgi:hypothetical protein
MSAPAQSDGAAKPTLSAVGGTMVIPPQPDEAAYPLRREQFDLLCEGEISEERTVRDICIAVFVSAFVGLIGLLATVDWNTAIREGRRAPFIWTASLAVAVFASLVSGATAQWRLSRIRTCSGYSRVRKRISDFFTNQTL